MRDNKPTGVYRTRQFCSNLNLSFGEFQRATILVQQGNMCPILRIRVRLWYWLEQVLNAVVYSQIRQMASAFRWISIEKKPIRIEAPSRNFCKPK
jgi:hypothetical protein